MKRSGMFTRALCLTMIVMLLALTAAPALAASKPSGSYVVTTTEKHDRLYVRSAPWGSVEYKLKKGTVVVYKYRKSGWWKVEFLGGSGFVDPDYLTSVARLPKAKYAPVDNLYVRNKPKGDAPRIGKLKAGKKVTIVKQKGTWVCIKYKGRTGWVAAKYLRRV